MGIGANGQYINQSRIYSASVDTKSAKQAANRIDGVLGGTVDADCRTDLHNGLFIGCRVNGSNAFTGDIAEVIMYNAVLSTAQREKVIAYLTKKWKITG
jgi:hypothetical protein